MRNRIEFNKNLVPYTIQVPLGSNIYHLYFQYNRVSDFYTVALYDNDGNVLCGDTKLNYGVELWAQEHRDVFPPVSIVPLDESNNTFVINKETAGEKVFLTIDDEVGDDDE